MWRAVPVVLFMTPGNDVIHAGGLDCGIHAEKEADAVATVKLDRPSLPGQIGSTHAHR